MPSETEDSTDSDNPFRGHISWDRLPEHYRNSALNLNKEMEEDKVEKLKNFSLITEIKANVQLNVKAKSLEDAIRKVVERRGKLEIPSISKNDVKEVGSVYDGMTGDKVREYDIHPEVNAVLESIKKELEASKTDIKKCKCSHTEEDVKFLSELEHSDFHICRANADFIMLVKRIKQFW